MAVLPSRPLTLHEAHCPPSGKVPCVKGGLDSEKLPFGGSCFGKIHQNQYLQTGFLAGWPGLIYSCSFSSLFCLFFQNFHFSPPAQTCLHIVPPGGHCVIPGSVPSVGFPVSSTCSGFFLREEITLPHPIWNTKGDTWI